MGLWELWEIGEHWEFGEVGKVSKVGKIGEVGDVGKVAEVGKVGEVEDVGEVGTAEFGIINSFCTVFIHFHLFSTTFQPFSIGATYNVRPPRDSVSSVCGILMGDGGGKS